MATWGCMGAIDINRSFVGLIGAFVVVAAGFLASAIVREARSTAIDTTIQTTQGNSLPSVEALAKTRAALRHLDVDAERFADDVVAKAQPSRAPLVEDRAELGRELDKEVVTPDYPGEASLRAAADRELEALDGALARLTAPRADAAAAFRDVHAAIDRSDEAVERLFEIDAKHARSEVEQVINLRTRTTRLAIALDAACLLMTVFAAIVVVRAQRKRREAERAHEQVLVERANELEMFAKRVAHDLLKPNRGARVHALVDQAPGEPRPGVRQSARARRLVREAVAAPRRRRAATSRARARRRRAERSPTSARQIKEVLDEARADEAEPVNLVVEPFDDVRVRCAPGVLASVFANLVRNAIKYMGGRPVRRVTVRVSRAGELAHIEVADTGPGLPAGLEARVFNPYVRAADSATPGLGLGLATVRRFVSRTGGAWAFNRRRGRGRCSGRAPIGRRAGVKAARALHSRRFEVPPCRASQRAHVSIARRRASRRVVARGVRVVFAARRRRAVERPVQQSRRARRDLRAIVRARRDRRRRGGDRERARQPSSHREGDAYANHDVRRDPVGQARSATASASAAASAVTFLFTTFGLVHEATRGPNRTDAKAEARSIAPRAGHQAPIATGARVTRSRAAARSPRASRSDAREAA